MSNRIAIVDGNPLVYRADSVSDLTTPQGLRVSGVYGALEILELAVESLAPTHLFIVWDSRREETWRRYIYPDYKLNREPKTPEDVEKRRVFHEQLKLLYRILRYFPVRQFLQCGMEGDDLAYWITRRMYAWGHEGVSKHPDFVCITVDRDWLQLVDHSTKVYFSDTQTLVDTGNFQSISGELNVEDFLIRKSIVGDTGDNVKGVPGVGPKTVDKVKNECWTLEDYAERIPKVLQFYDAARFSRLLVDLSLFPYTDDLDKHLHKTSLPTPDLKAARKAFEELHFTRFLSIWKPWTRVFERLQI